MIINDELLKKIKNNYIGRGANASCFKFDDKVFKEYGNANGELIENIGNLLRFKSDLIAFPEEFAFDNDGQKIIGYIMKYIEGIKLSEIKDEEDINDFLKALINLENEIRILSEKGLLMWDVHPENMIYKNGLLTIIDTDSYELSSEDGFNIYKSNLKQMGISFYEFFLRSISFKLDKIDYYKNLCILQGKLKISNLFGEIILEEENITKEKINTFHDFNEKLLLLRR